MELAGQYASRATAKYAHETRCDEQSDSSFASDHRFRRHVHAEWRKYALGQASLRWTRTDGSVAEPIFLALP
jgi:hypothetical protein